MADFISIVNRAVAQSPSRPAAKSLSRADIIDRLNDLRSFARGLEMAANAISEPEECAALSHLADTLARAIGALHDQVNADHDAAGVEALS